MEVLLKDFICWNQLYAINKIMVIYKVPLQVIYKKIFTQI